MPYKDKEKNRLYQKEWSRQLSIKNRVKVIDLLGGKCAVCGYCENHLALQVDHIKPVLRIKNHRFRESGSNTMKSILNGKINLKDIQLLCANCHAIKSYEDRLKYKNYDKPKR